MMKMNKSTKRGFATAVALPTILSLCVSPAMAQTSGGESSNFDPNKTIITATVTGLNSGDKIQVKNGSGSPLASSAVAGGSVELTYDRKSSNNSILIQAEDDKFQTSAAKCIGIKMPEGYAEALKKAEEAHKSYVENGQTQDTENAYASMKNNTANANDRSNLLVTEDDKSKSEEDLPNTEDMVDEVEVSDDETPNDEKSGDETSGEETPNNDSSGEEASGEASGEETSDKNTDGSNTPVADAQSLKVKKKAKSLSAEVAKNDDGDLTYTTSNDEDKTYGIGSFDSKVDGLVDNIVQDAQDKNKARALSNNQARPLADGEADPEVVKGAEQLKSGFFEGMNTEEIQNSPWFKFLKEAVKHSDMISMVGDILNTVGMFATPGAIRLAANTIPGGKDFLRMVEQSGLTVEQISGGVKGLTNALKLGGKLSKALDLILNLGDRLKEQMKKIGSGINIKIDKNVEDGEGIDGEDGGLGGSSSGGINSVPDSNSLINASSISNSIAKSIKASAERVPLSMNADDRAFSVNNVSDYHYIECSLDFVSTEVSAGTLPTGDATTDKKEGEKPLDLDSIFGKYEESDSDSSGAKINVTRGSRSDNQDDYYDDEYEEMDRLREREEELLRMSQQQQLQQQQYAQATAMPVAAPMKVGPKVDTGGEIDNSLFNRVFGAFR